jgi:nicotinic acid mononucleotide adenylyltransferase
MGADSFAGLQQWHRAAEIPYVAPLIVASRPGQRMDDITALLPAGLQLEQECESEPIWADAEKSRIELRCYTLLNPEGERAPFYLLPDLDVPISASQVREGIRQPTGAGSPAEERELVPAAVAEYIRARGLYR